MDVRLGTFNLNNLFDRFNFEADLGVLPAEDRDVLTTYQWVFVGQGAGPATPHPSSTHPPRRHRSCAFRRAPAAS